MLVSKLFEDEINSMVRFESDRIRVSPWDLFSLPVIEGPSNSGNVVRVGDGRIVLIESAVDDEQVSVSKMICSKVCC